MTETFEFHPPLQPEEQYLRSCGFELHEDTWSLRSKFKWAGDIKVTYDRISDPIYIQIDVYRSDKGVPLFLSADFSGRKAVGETIPVRVLANGYLICDEFFADSAHRMYEEVTKRTEWKRLWILQLAAFDGPDPHGWWTDKDSVLEHWAKRFQTPETVEMLEATRTKALPAPGDATEEEDCA